MYEFVSITPTIIINIEREQLERAITFEYEQIEKKLEMSMIFALLVIFRKKAFLYH